MTTLKNAALLLELAQEPGCPKRQFFLSCLYLLVGDAFRTQGRTCDLKQLELLMAKASTVENQEIQKWLKRSEELLSSSLGYFDYKMWCLGGYVSQDLKLMKAKKRKKSPERSLF